MGARGHVRGGAAVVLGGLLVVLSALGAAPASAADAGHGNERMGPANARTTSVSPSAGPDFELPFLCGQSWTGSTRSSHSPSAYTVDFNAPGDYRQPVLASASGTVVKTVSLTYSYGRYVVIDHGGGFTTLYAHLDSIATTVGTVVEQGDLIGYLGTTGGSTGPHLHFEERKDGAYFPPYFHRTTFRFGSTLASQSCSDRPFTADWNGDGRTDLGIARSTASAQQFWQLTRKPSGNTSLMTAWGAPSDKPAAGDYDGDGLSQLGVRKMTSGDWQLRSRSGATATVPRIGYSHDTPVVGDWDGNGRDNLGVYRSSTRTFWLRQENGSYKTVAWGSAGDRPVVGDWNGDGRSDVGVYRDGTFTLRVPSGSSHTTRRVAFGQAGDVGVAGDWDGNGTSEVGVWRPSTGTFYLDAATITAVRWGNAAG